MTWLVKQLFGSQAAAHLGDKISAAVAAYLLAQPTATIDQIKALIIGRADSLIGSVAAFFPAWARPLLTPVLDSALSNLVDSAYNSLIRPAQAATTGTPLS